MLPRLENLPLVIALAAAAPAAAQAPPGSAAAATATEWRQFFSRSRTFHLDVPADWQQLSPVTSRELRERFPHWPREVTAVQPNLFYAVGPVERWLAGEFDQPFLYVMEQGNEWATGADFELQLAAMWREKGAQDGVDYEVAEVARAAVGPNQHPVITCRRTARGKIGPALHTFDVYAPTGGSQVSLVFCSPGGRLPAGDPSLHKMLSTLTFARRPKGEPSLGNRLTTPILAGVLVGLVLVFLHRRNRRLVSVAHPPH